MLRATFLLWSLAGVELSWPCKPVLGHLPLQGVIPPSENYLPNYSTENLLTLLSLFRNLDAHASMLTFPAQNVVMAKVAWMKETRQEGVVDKTGMEVQEMITTSPRESKVPLSVLKEK